MIRVGLRRRTCRRQLPDIAVVESPESLEVTLLPVCMSEQTLKKDSIPLLNRHGVACHDTPL